jgi:hypothetical protein
MATQSYIEANRKIYVCCTGSSNKYRITAENISLKNKQNHIDAEYVQGIYKQQTTIQKNAHHQLHTIHKTQQCRQADLKAISFNSRQDMSNTTNKKCSSTQIEK